ncbi:MAG: hypothetical protein H0X38_02565 [Planctomycetes bacterium]|nr:hypothetical protein [Planctomycetota bacterium]
MLAPLAAGGPHTMTVQGATLLTIADVLVGEVWLASGQSNMARTLGDEGDAARTTEHPTLRFLTTHPGKGGTTGEWKSFTPTDGPAMSAVAFHFAHELQEKLRVPVGMVIGAQGSVFIQRWFDPQVEPADPGMKRGGDLFQGYLAAVVPYAVRGAIWYQGEADARAGYDRVYQQRLIALVRYWRRTWQRPQLPFLIVQLPNTGPLQSDVDQETAGWPLVRNAQRLALALPGTALAVGIDIGDGKVHPSHKQPFGYRLSLAARALAYGEKGLVYAGPLYASSIVAGRTVRVRFTQVGGGLVAKGGALTGFAIAGADGHWAWGEATIAGDTVTVTSPAVAAPTQVRYAWAANPLFNLFNAEGLPASPFQTSEPAPGPAEGIP